jgi:gliding motility-associated-like protein
LQTGQYHTLKKIIALHIIAFFYSTSVFAQAPVANFTANVTSGCAGLTVSFSDLSTGNPVTWNWSFKGQLPNNSQLSTQRNPIVTFTTPDIYTVKLVVKNNAGLSQEEKVGYIIISQAPVVNFDADVTTACAPATINFRDLTVPINGNSIVNWEWNFGDGSPTSSLQNPSHRYVNQGFFTVTLKVTTNNGCKVQKTTGRYIRIIDGISTNFSFNQPGTCRPPFLVDFQDLSNGPGTLTYAWDFGASASPSTSTIKNPTTSFNAIGTYPVKLSVISSLGCTGDTIIPVTITGKTTDFISPSSICIGQTVTFQNNSSPVPVSSEWTFTEVATSSITTSSQINATQTFLASGQYRVKVVNQYNGCKDSTEKTVNVITQPTVDFKAVDSTSCNVPFTVQFNDQSPSGVNSWLWDFGDGGSSNLQNPSHTYTIPGNHTVTLTITLPGGCSNTITKTEYIKIQPITIKITNAPNGGCIPFSYSPLTEIISADAITSYSWDMGEPGGTYTAATPTHIYNNAGTYDVKLTVTAQNGCSKTETVLKAIKTGVKPIVNFNYTPNNVCASTPIIFTDASTTTSGAEIKWLWDFGDSTFSDLQNPQHVYEDTGDLRIKFIVFNNGCTDSAFKIIKVLPPVANFGYTVDDCNNRRRVTFHDSTLANAVYGPITYLWSMGDPSNTTFTSIVAPTFTYPGVGVYNASLTVTNGACSYTKTRQVIIVDEPADVSISKTPICKGEKFTLSAINSNPNNIKEYNWTIGPFTYTDTTRSIQSSLGAYGTYNVTLLIKDTNNCISTRTLPNYITVSGPVSNFIPSSPGNCINKPVAFTDQSTPSGTISEWKWSFGDGSQQVYTSPPFSHTYAEPGSYDVTLIVKTTINCTDTFKINKAVLITNPKAAFKADTFYCPLRPLPFTDTSSGIGLTYNWDFGDASPPGSGPTPSHSYPPGDNNYTVKLTITDAVGCTSEITKNQYIKIRKPKPAFTMIDSVGICIPLNTSFTFAGTDYKSFYWDFGDLNQSTIKNPSNFYDNYGTYTPKLYLIGPGGCIDSAQGTVRAYDPATTTQVNANNTVACNELTVDFNLTLPSGFAFKFYYGDGGADSSLMTALTHKYVSPGNFLPFAIISDRFGCEVVKLGPTINVYGAVPLFDKSKSEFCDQGDVFFPNYTISNDAISSFVWDFGDQTPVNNTDFDPTHSFQNPGRYLVTLSVTTVNNCTNSFVDTVFIYKTPEVSIVSRDTLCLNAPEKILSSITRPDSTIKWAWTFGNNTTSDQAEPTVTYSATGNYTITLIGTNKLGCFGTADTTINVTDLPTATPITDPIQIIAGGSTALNMNYTGPVLYYNWLPTQNLSCIDCPAPIATPKATTKYAVQVEDRYGCKNTGYITVKVACTNQNVFIPNTFSPNGDGNNDVFYPRGTGLFRIKALRIFNRWGELVFERREFPANSVAQGWDGNYKGKKAPADVYIYQAEIYCDNGELVKYTGDIALLR